MAPNFRWPIELVKKNRNSKFKFAHRLQLFRLALKNSVLHKKSAATAAGGGNINWPSFDYAIVTNFRLQKPAWFRLLLQVPCASF